MEVEIGDWVRSEAGEQGMVTLTYKKSAYIYVRTGVRGPHLKNFPMTELTKIAKPADAPK